METNEEIFLQGTGNEKGFDKDWLDRYIKSNTREGADYEVMSEKMWIFCESKFGSDLIVKRFYQKQSTWSNWTRLENNLK